MSLQFAQRDSEAAALPRFARPGIIVFVLCFALGILGVAWHIRLKASAERARAQIEARGRAAAVELQFSRPVRAAELLGILARQSGGGISNFAQVAGDIYAAFPDLASLELQPGGVVSDIIPRAGNQRAIGFNVFKDPAYRDSATAALQSGTCTIAAPLLLYRGGPGLVVRVPVFQKTRGGENRFWGFVAASMGIPEALRAAGLGDVSKGGYDYALFVAGPASGKAIALSRSGLARLEDSVVQSFRLQNLELRLALRRHGGWVDKPKALLESVMASVVPVLISALVAAMSSRKRSEAALMRARQVLADENSQRTCAYQDLANKGAGTELELKKTTAELEAAQAELARQKDLTSDASDKRRSAEAALQQAQENANDLQTRLEQATKTHVNDLAAKQAEIADAHAKLKAGAEKIEQLEAVLTEAVKTGEAATSNLKLLETKAQTQRAELQTRLEAQKAATSKATAAEHSKVKELEAVIQELEAKLTAAEGAHDRGAELEVRLSAARAELKPEANPLPVITPAVSLTSMDDNSDSSAEPETRMSKPAKSKRVRRKDRNQIDLFTATPAEASPEFPVASRNAPAEPVPDSTSSGLEETTAGEPVEAAELPASESEVPPEGRSLSSDRKPPPRRAVDVAQLRRASHEIVPLLVDRDPGARDCFKANRSVFRSAFLPAAFDEFEQLVKDGTFESALDRLSKVARKHGINI